MSNVPATASVHQLQERLSHVVWLGGGTDAGKSSIVKKLGEKYRFRWYNFDYFEPVHFQRMDHDAHPATFAFLAMSIDERWVLRSVEEMARSTIAMWRERFGLVVDDLLGWPRDGLIIAEGPGLFPEDVVPCIAASDQALWLTPTDTFKRQVFATRENKLAVAAATSDPPLAQRKMIERDLLIGDHIREQAQVRGFPVLAVDGARSVVEYAAAVEEHFARLLQQAPGR